MSISINSLATHLCSRNWTRAIVVAVVTGLLCCEGAVTSPVLADDSAAIEHFEKRVRPVLIAHCVKCHGAEKSESGLRLDQQSRIAQETSMSHEGTAFYCQSRIMMVCPKATVLSQIQRFGQQWIVGNRSVRFTQAGDRQRTRQTTGIPDLQSIGKQHHLPTTFRFESGVKRTSECECRLFSPSER